jgi:hypothetical protein
MHSMGADKYRRPTSPSGEKNIYFTLTEHDQYLGEFERIRENSEKKCDLIKELWLKPNSIYDTEGMSGRFAEWTINPR